MCARSYIENHLFRPSLDGNHAVVERICHAIARWITTDDTPLDGLNDARLVDSLTLRESTKMFRSFAQRISRNFRPQSEEKVSIPSDYFTHETFFSTN